jgi:hypothetical protein
MKKVATPTETMHNKNKNAVAELHLKGSFVQNAQRTQKNINYHWRQEPYPLRWNHFDAPVLQKTETEVVSTKESFFSSTVQSVPSGRLNRGHDLRFNRRHLPLKQNQDSSGQRRFPTDYWPKEFSLRHQSETFSEIGQSEN